MNEQEIIRRLRERDEQGIQELLHHYAPLMRYIIAPILTQEQDREECLSETVMRVWDKIESYDPEKGRWTTWLTVLTRNTALNKLRAGREETQELSHELSSPGPSPEEHVLEQERRDAVQRAIGRLSERDKLIFYRKYYYRQSTAQIARELGLTERAVEGRLYRIRKNLRERLGGEGYD